MIVSNKITDTILVIPLLYFAGNLSNSEEGDWVSERKKIPRRVDRQVHRLIDSEGIRLLNPSTERPT